MERRYILKVVPAILVLLSLLQGVSALSEGEVETFEYTGSPQEFEVPENGLYELRVWGAQGGAGYNTEGGYGGYAEGEIQLDENDKLHVYVGGKGGTPDGGWNGGGDGGIDTGSGQTGGGGGGATDIRIGGTNLEDRIIVAGGGAGGGRDGETGEGGGLTGTASVEDEHSQAQPGQPGTQNEGGDVYTTSRGATPGKLGEGGQGSTNQNAAGGGGGGGGYYGGGGGTSLEDHGDGWSAGGGGGSSYIAELDNASTSTGVNNGHGYIEIELIEVGQSDFCNYRGPFNECIMNQTNQLNNQQYNVSSIFEVRENAVFEAFSGRATLNITNSTSISGMWRGEFSIQTDDPRIEPGAEFKPENGRIIVGN